MSMTTEDVKRLIGLTTAKHDEYIFNMIQILSEFVSDYCNRSFDEGLPSGVKLFIAKAIQYNMNVTGITGRSMGGVSYSYESDYPPSVMRLLRPYKRMRFV